MEGAVRDVSLAARVRAGAAVHAPGETGKGGITDVDKGILRGKDTVCSAIEMAAIELSNSKAGSRLSQDAGGNVIEVTSSHLGVRAAGQTVLGNAIAAHI